jgi:hypothetical protein
MNCDADLARVPVIVCSANTRTLDTRREELCRFRYTVPRQPFDIDDLRAMARVMLDAAVS